MTEEERKAGNGGSLPIIIRTQISQEVLLLKQLWLLNITKSQKNREDKSGMEYREFTGKTVEDAVMEAAIKLETTSDRA